MEAEQNARHPEFISGSPVVRENVLPGDADPPRRTA